jgi:3-dehydroquinate dehydratase/shikimate dehydrogenase
MAYVCVPILVSAADIAAADPAAGTLARAHAAKDAGADLVEIRVDEAFDGDLDGAEGARTVGALERIVRECPLPCVVTCRVAREGGHYDGDESARISLLERLGTGPRPPAYIDVEASAYDASANLRQKVHLVVRHAGQLRDGRAGLILSTHDFTGRPADLSRRLARMQSTEAASVVKVAYMARSLRDALELLDVAREAGRPTIALGMGEFGLMTRVLAPKFGGFLTFAAMTRAEATAPGQPTVRELLGRYRFRSITARTRVYGVVGWPIAHSRSPALHNAGFEAIAHDGVYLPLPVAGGEDPAANAASLKATLIELCEHPRLDFAGCSVTLPHKEGLVDLARARGWAIDDAARATGAGNTLVWSGADATARVLNTDAPALAHVLARAVGGTHASPGARTLEGVRVAVLGAGGVARAAAWAAASQGADVVVYGRTRAKAEALVAMVRDGLAPRDGSASGEGGRGAKVVAADWELLPRACARVFVQCTPVGMARADEKDATERVPLDVGALTQCAPEPVLVETIYTPRETAMMRAARQRGWTTVGGSAMFIEQAEMQFEAWTGVRPPAGLFARVLDGEWA